MYNLFNVNKNAKTSKNEKQGYLTGMIYLLPNQKTCPNAEKAGCFKSCLVNSGNAMMFKKINEGRLRKTIMFYEEREKFFELLIKDIEKLIKQANKENLIPLIRLNGTSDIPYEKFIVKEGKNIFQLYPSVQFYDYTKIAHRLNHNIPNYDLTFSYSGSWHYEKEVDKAIKFKNRIAVVFYGGIPETFLGRKVIDGDESDLRHLEQHNVIVGLKYKGRLSSLDTQFVVKI